MGVTVSIVHKFSKQASISLKLAEIPQVHAIIDPSWQSSTMQAMREYCTWIEKEALNPYAAGAGS